MMLISTQIAYILKFYHNLLLYLYIIWNVLVPDFRKFMRFIAYSIEYDFTTMGACISVSCFNNAESSALRKANQINDSESDTGFYLIKKYQQWIF